MEKRYQNIIQIYNTVAQKYQDKFANDTVYNHSYDLLLKHMEPIHKNVLDVACGFGKITNYLLNHNPKLSVLGVDAAENMVALAKQNNPNASFKVMDCREINNLQQDFNVIIFGFCFPYLTKEDVLKLIKDAATMLHPNGLLYISTMIGDYEKDSRVTSSSDGKNLMFIHYHEPAYLIEALETQEFKILENYTKLYQEGGDTDLFLIAKK
ncbi:class I SAM-dependent methyltransferase [Tenacibaculum discolor]|uniref:class I SAM-dependent methyltransferase n=1 Tax=Tenacibaculum discolor TaxID=361581 RepID=UPI000F5B1920|nr:class I SAM-dependent methyltransferase [Tenacibaculum discolor]